MVMMIMSLVGCNSSKGGGATFEGAAEGKNGPIKVKVTVDQDKIKEIDVVENHETEFTKSAFEEMLKKIKEANSVDVDVVAGATLTSKAIIAAVSDAVGKSEMTAKTFSEGETANYTPGKYEGEGKGFEGPIKVSVNLSKTKVDGIEVLSHNESEGLGDKAIETVVKSILDKQRLDVETLGGTTIEIKPVLPPCERLKDITPADAKKGIKVYHFDTDGSTCSTAFKVTLDGTKMVDAIFEGDPCVGNSEGIKSLINGMELEDVIKEFKGIMCPGAGDTSSCPDQLAIALRQISNRMKGIKCDGHAEAPADGAAATCTGNCDECVLEKK